MGKHVFCTDLCRERGEPFEGLGHAPQRILMLAWPRGHWRTPRWESVDMSPALAEAIHNAAHAGVHVALVDKVEAPGSLPMLHALPEGIFASFEDEADLIAAINGYADGQVFAGESDPRTTIICCTDSRRDACCARYGFSTYKALVAVADTARFNIVQATHIGGCRFAASLVVMPQRQRYGRMTAGLAPAFLAALERGEIFLPGYKGRADLPEPAQVAEIAALRWGAQRGEVLDRVELTGEVPEEAADGMALTLGAELGGQRLAIRLLARNFTVQGNCEIVAEGHEETVVRWCLDEVRAAADDDAHYPNRF